MPSPPVVERVFRKAALDKLAAPDQLDQAVSITNPATWLALSVLLVLTCGMVAWGAFGHVRTRVVGQGILIANSGQVFDAITAAAGTLVFEDVRPGATVKKGQVLARLLQPDLAQRIADAIAKAEMLEQELERQTAEVQESATVRRANNIAREEAIRDGSKAAQQREEAYRQMLSDQESLLGRGIVTRERVQQIREQLASARQAVADGVSRLLQVQADEIAANSADFRLLSEARQRAVDARTSAVQLSLQRSAFGEVFSPADGYLLEWKVATGTYVAAGTALASVESGDRGLEFVLYVPPDQGKRVRSGMEVRIELSGMKKEEWGTLEGQIVSTSAFPSTTQGMLSVLQNDTLVKSFAAKGAPFAARVSLVPSEEAASGYAWSGGSGPPTALSSGMTGRAQVTVQDQNPASFVIPFLRKAGL